MVKIFTDTSANLPVTLTKAHNITVIPFSYTVGGVPADNTPGRDFDGKAFYDAMRAGADVQTSMINTHDFTEAFTPVLEDGCDVLYVGMSGGISGTAHAAVLAADELSEQYPDRKILTVDTYAASMGEGLLVLLAAQLLESGTSLEETYQTLLARRETLCQYFTVDDLAYLKKGGRLSGAGAFVGTLLQIKPILMGDDTGHIVACHKVRGRRQSLCELARRYDALVKDRAADISIAHADCPEDVEFLLTKLRECGFGGNCITVCYEPVTGSHVGPGTVALFFPGTHK